MHLGLRKSLKEQKVGLLEIGRDFIVATLPFRLPRKWIERLYGFEPDFVFLTHPRGREDIYSISPILRQIKKIIPDQILYRLLSYCPCYVVATIVSPQGLRGFVISTTRLPADLFSNRIGAMRILNRSFGFIRKISYGKVYIGLAAWWPIVTNSGLACEQLLSPDDRISVTNGHCATTASLYLTVHKLAKLAGTPISEIDILIIGAGRMGSSVARVLNGKVRKLGLIDSNPVRLKALKAELLRTKPSTTWVESLMVSDTSTASIGGLLARYHIGICTTSNMTYLADVESLHDCIILDDARPEAFPRLVDLRRKVIVLEGGTIRLKGIQISHNFGFGRRDNVFGCLAEAFVLALDRGKSLHPTLGEIDRENFEKMLTFCHTYAFTEGELKSGDLIVKDGVVREVLMSKYRKFEQVQGRNLRVTQEVAT